MKPIKMLGLAMLAALTAMAFVGASSAMAEPTQLCKVDTAVLIEGVYVETGPCPEGQGITEVHAETLEGEQGKLLSSAGTVTCKITLFLGEVLGLGEPQIIHGHFKYETCEKEGTSCTVSEVSTDSLILVLREGHETATITGHGEVNVHCGLLINCTYNGENLKGIGKGPLLSSTLPTGHFVIEKAPVKKVTGLCPEKAELDLNLHPLIKTYLAK